MKKILIIALMSILCGGNANAEITTKKQADTFINQYCISLVNKFEKIVEGTRDLDTHTNIGARQMKSESKSIGEIVDIYSKLCK